MEHKSTPQTIVTNSATAWWLAIRPKTLAGAAMPILVSSAFAYIDSSRGQFFQIIPAILCLLFALVMQIDANLVNDYFDYKKGNDDSLTRLGPKRACSEGWITPSAMVRGIAVTTIAACFIGLPLIIYGGFEMVYIGIACVIFCFLYTLRLSYLGLGDVLVLVFFGFVPVCFTYYLELPISLSKISIEVFLASMACGLATDALLIVNNYRDRDNDRAAHKMTLAVCIGARRTELLYLAVGVAAAVLMAMAVWMSIGKMTLWPGLLMAAYAVAHATTYRKMVAIGQGRLLNGVLNLTARNILLFGLLSIASLLIS